MTSPSVAVKLKITCTAKGRKKTLTRVVRTPQSSYCCGVDGAGGVSMNSKDSSEAVDWAFDMASQGTRGSIESQSTDGGRSYRSHGNFLGSSAVACACQDLDRSRL